MRNHKKEERTITPEDRYLGTREGDYGLFEIEAHPHMNDDKVVLVCLYAETKEAYERGDFKVQRFITAKETAKHLSYNLMDVSMPVVHMGTAILKSSDAIGLD